MSGPTIWWSTKQTCIKVDMNLYWVETQCYIYIYIYICIIYNWCSSINWVERSTKYVLLKKRIYIYTRFQKGFHIERYLDRYILLFACTCARVQFSFAIVQLVKKLGSTINFFFVGFFVPIWKEHVVWVFLEKSIRPAIQICNGELYDWFWEWGKQPAK